MNDFDRRRAQFDREWEKSNRTFSAFFAAIVVVNIALLALGAWAVIELVQWVTSK